MIAEIYFTCVLMMALGIYCVVIRPNLIKKIMGLAIFTDAIHLFIINMGFRENGIPPIISPDNIGVFAMLSVDPVPQAMVLTSIVINFSITAFALGLSVIAYRHFGTLDTDKMNKLRG